MIVRLERSAQWAAQMPHYALLARTAHLQSWVRALSVRQVHFKVKLARLPANSVLVGIARQARLLQCLAQVPHGPEMDHHPTHNARGVKRAIMHFLSRR